MQECERRQNAMPDPQDMPDVLTNLQNLVDAQGLFEVAERLQEEGKLREALVCYDLVSKLCPGSQIDARARVAGIKVLGDILVGTPEAIAQEKQQGKFDDWVVHSCLEIKPRTTTQDHANVGRCSAGVSVQVNCLIKACRLAVEAGRYQKAVELAREVYALDPERVAADPLVNDLHVVDCVLQHGGLTGACAGAAIGSAVGDCSNGCLMGAACGNCLHCMAAMAHAVACPNGYGKDKCAQGGSECCSKPCGNPNCACEKGKKCCCEGKAKSGKNGCSPCSGKPAADCCTEAGCGKKCGGCQTGAEKPCDPSPKQPPADDQSVEDIQIELEPPGATNPSTDAPPPDEDSSVQLRPCLPPVDGTVVEDLEKVQAQAEEQESKEGPTAAEEDKPLCEFLLGLGVDLFPCDCGLFKTFCADVKTTPEQLELLWQVKLGPWLCQVRYGKPGLNVDVQPIDSDEPADGKGLPRP